MRASLLNRSGEVLVLAICLCRILLVGISCGKVLLSRYPMTCTIQLPTQLSAVDAQDCEDLRPCNP